MKRPGPKGWWELYIGGNFVMVGKPGYRAAVKKAEVLSKQAIARVTYPFTKMGSGSKKVHRHAVAFGGFILTA